MNVLNVSAVGFFSLVLMACSSEEAVVIETKEAPLKPVRTLTVSAGATITKSLTGVVDAAKTAELGFRVSGELVAINKKESEFVKKGDVLAQLDQADFKIKLEASQAEFDRAKAEFKRAKNLIKQGAISASDYEKLQAQLSSAKSQLNGAQKNMEYTVLKAPFDGVVAKQYFSNFEKITSSSTFATIQDLSSYEVKINVPESIMIKVKRNDAPKVYAVFDGDQDKQYPLTFKETSTRADEKTQTYSVRFMMAAPKGINLLPGMSATVFVEKNIDETSANGMYVPTHAVLEDSQGRFIYVVNPTDDTRGEVIRRSVVVGNLDENGMQILQGLDSGDRVVTAGMSKISQGLVVRLMDGK
jgi:RND family efflux transporter MFP subunit